MVSYKTRTIRIAYIETEIWCKNNEGILEYKGQKNALDVFKELKEHLEQKELIPDEYFSFNDYSFKDNKEFPDCYRLVSYAVYGDSEGIYLDVDLYTKDKKQKTKIIHFVTGKTLSTSNKAMNRMYKIAREITKIFGRI